MADALTCNRMKTLNASELKKFVFEIKARKHKNGFLMNSTVLPCPLWYSTLNKAIQFAKSVARGRSCEIHLHDSKGAPINTFQFSV